MAKVNTPKYTLDKMGDGIKKKDPKEVKDAMRDDADQTEDDIKDDIDKIKG